MEFSLFLKVSSFLLLLYLHPLFEIKFKAMQGLVFRSRAHLSIKN